MASNDLNFASVEQSEVSPRSAGIPFVAGMAISAGSRFTTDVIFNPKQATIAAGAILSTAGTLTIQRYIDSAGVIPQGNATTLSLSAGVAASVTVGDSLPFLSYAVTVTPANSAAATLTNLKISLRAKEAFGGDASVPFALDLILAELRVQTLFLQSLINNLDNLSRARLDQLTELGSLVSAGLGS